MRFGENEDENGVLVAGAVARLLEREVLGEEAREVRIELGDCNWRTSLTRRLEQSHSHFRGKNGLASTHCSEGEQRYRHLQERTGDNRRRKCAPRDDAIPRQTAPKTNTVWQHY